MPIDVKICGLKTPAAVDAAVENGAVMIGFVFYAKSPRYVTPTIAQTLGQSVPKSINKVGLIVDADDEAIAAILNEAKLDMLQLHGHETPTRTAEIRARFGKPVIKAISLSEARDITAAQSYEDVADLLLFDAKPPSDLKGALPGGNGIPFDWSLLRSAHFNKPWLLAGGLNASNLLQAIRQTRTKAVDVSTGVEDLPGEKSISKIKELLDIAHNIS